MKSRDLIIKTARRLDKFNLDELIVVSELDEKEVTEEVFRSHLKEFKNNPKIYAESSDLDEMAFAISDF